MLNRLHRWRSSWATHRRRTTAIRKIRDKPKPLMLHLGCGQIHFPGWVHLDADTSLPHSDAVWQSDDGLPCEDGSCQFIYSEHFVEHLSVAQGLFLFRECRRVLSPTGVLRIGMPDMKEFVRQYWENDWDQQPWLKKYGYTRIKTGCEMVNTVFRDWGHLWVYDHEELHRRLNEAGFQTIRDMPPNQSDFPELQNRESRFETTLICEAS